MDWFILILIEDIPLCQPFKDEIVSVWVKDPVRTAQKTLSASVIKTNKLMLYKEIIAVCSEIHAKHINALCGQNTESVNVRAGGT